MNDIRKRLDAMGFNTEGFSDGQLASLTPQEMERLAQESAPSGRSGRGPLLGEASGTGGDVQGEVPAQATDTAPSSGDRATPGTWETAMMSVAKTIPSIMQASQTRRPFAPSPNISGRRVMDIPKTGDVYGRSDDKFKGLLAMFLRK